MMYVYFGAYLLLWSLLALAVGGSFWRQALLGAGGIAAIIAAILWLFPDNYAAGYQAGLAVAAIGCVTAVRLWDRLLTRQLNRWRR